MTNGGFWGSFPGSLVSLMLGPSFLGSSVRRQFPTVSSSSHYDPRNEGPKGVSDEWE